MTNERDKDYKIRDSGTRKVYNTGANRDVTSGKGRFDLLPPQVLRALAVHFQKGAEKYQARNWEKGIPISRFIDSGLRHAFQFLDGCDDDENHLVATIWNFMCAYETIMRIQQGRLPAELYDLPIKIELPVVYEIIDKVPNMSPELKKKIKTAITPEKKPKKTK